MYASIVRTVVPVVVGILLVQAARLGVDLPEGSVTAVVTTVVTAVYYAGARLVEGYVSPLVGRLMLSAGLSRQTPQYMTGPPWRFARGGGVRRESGHRPARE